ncbi:hypothetical protein, partial [Sphingomonas sp. 28-62-11]
MARYQWWCITIIVCIIIAAPSNSRTITLPLLVQSAGQTTSAAPKKSADPDIVVSGLINKNKGPWKR